MIHADYQRAVNIIVEGEKAKTRTHNLGVCQAFWNTIPQNSRPGVEMTNIPGSPNFDPEAFRSFMRQMYSGRNWYNDAFGTWQISPFDTPAVVYETNTQKADRLLAEFTNQHPNGLRFNTRHPPGTPNWDALQQSHTLALNNGTEPPKLERDNLLAWIIFDDDYSAYTIKGGIVPLMDCIHTDTLEAIKLTIIHLFPEMNPWMAVDANNIPERDLVKMILLRFAQSSTSDMQDIENHFTSAVNNRTSQDSQYVHDTFLGESQRALGLMRKFKDWMTGKSSKYRKELYVKCLSSKALRNWATAELKANDKSFEEFYSDVMAKALSMHSAEPAITAAFAAGARGSTRSDSFKTKAKSNAAAAVTDADDDDDTPYAAAATASDTAKHPCFNCNNDNHPVSRCFTKCKMPECPNPDKIHKAKDCQLVITQAGYDKLKKVFFPTQSFRSNSSKKLISSSSTSTGRSLIQFDPGSNVNVSPKALPGFTSRRAPSSLGITVANNQIMPVTDIVPIGTQEFLIAPSCGNSLVSQLFIEAAKCCSLLYNSDLYIYDTSQSTSLAKIFSNQPLFIVHPTNDLHYFSLDQVKILADRVLLYSPGNKKSSATQKSFVARYHTIRFNNLQDVVLFWHENLNHASLIQMKSLVKNKIIIGLPSELTVKAIDKYFPHNCFNCSIGNLQAKAHPLAAVFNPKVPAGAWWSLDFKKYSGTDKEQKIASFGGFTHFFYAIDYATGRVFGYGTKGTKDVVQHIKKLCEFVRRKGKTVLGISIDAEFATRDVKTYLSDPVNALSFTLRHLEGDNERYSTSSDTFIMRRIAIPYEHFTIGEVERFNRTQHEAIIKKSNSNDNVTDKMWAFGAADGIDMYNSLPTARHPTQSPYQLFDGFTPNFKVTPRLPYGTTVVAQYPLALQTIRTGRGFEAVVIGRADDHIGGIKLFNPLTKKVIIRRTYKVIGDHPVKGLIFDKPITIEIDLHESTPTTSEPATIATPVPPQISTPMPALITVPPPVPVADEQIDPLHYQPYKKSNMYPNQRHYLNKVGLSFAEVDTKNPLHVAAMYTILDIVVATGHPRQFYYKYYDSNKPIPTKEDDFDYSLCKLVLDGGWANFELGRAIAHAVKSSKKKGIPTNFIDMMNHPEKAGFLPALIEEFNSWKGLGAIAPGAADIDWANVDPSDIGDLMLIFDKKYRPDGTFEKYKCRMVFRGDRWKNKLNLPLSATGVHIDALLIFLAVVAAEDLDLWKSDVKTAFLYGRFDSDTKQYVRSPHGVPTSLLPKKFLLGSCPYGHPRANTIWDNEYTSTLGDIGFKKIQSAASIMVKPATATTDKVIAAINTDDSLFAAPFGSAMKEVIKSTLESKYTMTHEDPVINYLGMQIVRNRENKTISIYLTKFMDQMREKYPLPPGADYPTSPMSYTKYLSKQELEDQQTLLLPHEITKLQGVLGDTLWIAMHTKPTVKYPLNVSSRTVSPAPTLYDYNQALRTMYYCIATADEPRIIGGDKGVILTSTVDSAYASHKDLKGQSCHTHHIAGGGAVIFETKKHTVTASSSAESEILGSAIADKTIKWARNYLFELGYDQSIPCPKGTPLGQDNTSAMKILENQHNTGKTKHLDLRTSVLRESRTNKIIEDFYLPTDHMPADIGTKATPPGLFKRLSDYVLGAVTLPHFQKFFY